MHQAWETGTREQLQALIVSERRLDQAAMTHSNTVCKTANGTSLVAKADRLKQCEGSDENTLVARPTVYDRSKPLNEQVRLHADPELSLIEQA